MAGVATIILAAGKGTRMKSRLPKVLHRVCGKAMAEHVLDSASAMGAERQVVVIGFGGDEVKAVLGERCNYALQAEQLGTGHAVLQAESAFRDFTGTIMVLCGDTPLLTKELLSDLLAEHRKQKNTVTILTAELSDPTGYGRIIRNQSGHVVKIVEQKDATDEERAVQEINTGIYCFESADLFASLRRITADNVQGEYYLTDVIEIFVKGGKPVGAFVAADAAETMGVNSRVQLAEAEVILRDRIRMKWMEAGVTLMDPASIFIDADVTIESDTMIYPQSWLEGKTKIGRDCIIGPQVHMVDTVVGDNVHLHFAHVKESSIGNNVNAGPFVHLRPGTQLANGVKVGNFVELKNSQVGEGSKVPHLSYIGDTTIGRKVNIGSGTITVNYDGKKKYRTTIEDEAFVGCNSNLVAPVTIGQGAYVAAGSTITKDVPPSALGVARAKQSNLEGWAQRKKEK
jgi:bifunctional UDP-N-acetylglucosamine pyrophosphorylase / glucosamine-1-phosphate N-acetyltransferase